MPNRIITLAVALAVVLLMAETVVADIAPCVRKDLPAGARCGTVAVPLSYEEPDSATLELKVIVLPARSGGAVADQAHSPVFYLVGGPGTAATESWRFFRDNMTALQESREVVLFDLRGLESSGDFQCPLSAAEKRQILLEFRASPGLKRCARVLEGRETLRTTVFAHDLDRVREAIGAERINLLGVSYGTRLALEYSRLYGNRVRASALRGVSSPSTNVLAQLMSGAQVELRALEKTNPGLLESYALVVKRLETKPANVQVGSDSAEHLMVDRLAFDAIIRFLLYDPQTARSLPSIVAATAAGEFGPLGQVVAGLESTIRRFSIPVLLGVLCAEDVPFWRIDKAAAGAGDRPFAPARLRDNAIATCRLWSVPAVEPAFRQPVRSTAPTLLLSGERDPATPAEDAELISKNLTRSLHLVTPGIGHHPTWTSCHTAILASFFDSGSLKGLDVSCASKFHERSR